VDFLLVLIDLFFARC